MLHRVYSRYPQRFLLCDEVGLGKTIEAGLVIRELLVHGLVQRVLILAPGGTLHQWQETLAEQFGLPFTRYDGQNYIEPDGMPSPASAQPWDDRDLLLASSHLIRRDDRRDKLLAARPFDLVVLDEAHHARRSLTQGRSDEPNKLLQVMHELQKRTEGLLLCTATPMQLDPKEAWDLLTLVGMAGRWGSNPELFAQYFAAAKRFPDGDSDLVLDMLHDALANGVEVDPRWDARLKAQLSFIQYRRFREALADHSQRPALLADPQAAEAIRQFALHHTPLRRFMCRNTRELLRRYYQQGLIQHRPADRRCEDRFIPLSPQEQRLYEEIERYVDAYLEGLKQGGRRGLGFLLQTYRRRLTSSSRAILETLRRKLDAVIYQTPGTVAGLRPDDLDEEEDVDLPAEGELADPEMLLPQAVVPELRRLIAALEQLPDDTKLQVLMADLASLRREHQKALIFTQYRDTQLYLREKLREAYGSRVACYSGMGGEYWNGTEWTTITKEEIQRRFTEGDAIEILVCTDAASEGLNLQRASLLINYDMPWNPMRVEQRIGRVDRLGQTARVVQIVNYYYEGTVEAEIYRRLRHRISLFETVVGALQPILARVPVILERLYEQRRDPAAVERAVTELLDQLDQVRSSPVNLDELADAPWEADLPPVKTHITPAEVETIWMRSKAIQRICVLEPLESGIYRLRWQGHTYTVAFSPDRVRTGVRYLTWGDPLFRAILQEALKQTSVALPNGVVRQVADAGRYRAVAYLVWNGAEWEEVTSLAKLEEAITRSDSLGPLPPAPDRVTERREQWLRQQQAMRNLQRQGQIQRLRAQARDLLAELAALLWARSNWALPNGESEVDGGPLVREFLHSRNLDPGTRKAWDYLCRHVAQWSEGSLLPVRRSLIEAKRTEVAEGHADRYQGHLTREAGRLVEALGRLNQTSRV
ncbi:MAG: helicase-related protein [Armatimonadota bacterium]|nr:helicase-related protein [Armatimonadota bacterium]